MAPEATSLAGIVQAGSSLPSRISRAISFDSLRYQVPSSSSIAGNAALPVPSLTAVRFFRASQGSGTTSYGTPWSISAFSTFQHGCPSSLTHWLPQRCSLIVMGATIRLVRAVFDLRPAEWAETLAVLQSVSLADTRSPVRAQVVEVDGARVTIGFPGLDGETRAQQLLAGCISGEWADRGDFESCRLVSAEWPEGLPGPQF